MKAMYLSQEQYDKLNADLKQMKTVDRKKVIADIAQAREHGDLRENAEYNAAREKQALLEAKIARLEDTISRSRIITDEMQAHPAVHVGSRVKLIDTKTKEEIEYELVPSAEFNSSDLDSVSVDSPVGKALVGKSVDDLVEINVPAGSLTYKITEII